MNIQSRTKILIIFLPKTPEISMVWVLSHQNPVCPHNYSYCATMTDIIEIYQCCRRGYCKNMSTKYN